MVSIITDNSGDGDEITIIKIIMRWVVVVVGAADNKISFKIINGDRKCNSSLRNNSLCGDRFKEMMIYLMNTGGAEHILIKKKIRCKRHHRRRGQFQKILIN